MAKASEQFRQSDVTTWGIVALVCGALAIFGANVSALLPKSVIEGLHQPRLAGATLETLRSEVGDLLDEARRLRNENDQLQSRFSMQEQASTETRRRVGALELTVPKLVEALPDDAAIDRSNITASIATPSDSDRFEADGGSVVVRRSPLSGSANQPLPDPVSTGPYGVALGNTVRPSDAASRWADLTAKLGPLLLGMTPLLADDTKGDGQLLIAGPIADLDQATDLCARLEQVAIACAPQQFQGTPLSGEPVNSSEGG